jgi:hypothetical protein
MEEMLEAGFYPFHASIPVIHDHHNSQLKLSRDPISAARLLR